MNSPILNCPGARGAAVSTKQMLEASQQKGTFVPLPPGRKQGHLCISSILHQLFCQYRLEGLLVGPCRLTQRLALPKRSALPVAVELTTCWLHAAFIGHWARTSSTASPLAVAYCTFMQLVTIGLGPELPVKIHNNDVKVAMVPSRQGKTVMMMH